MCRAKCEIFASSRNNEVTDTTVPAGTKTGVADATCRIRLFG
jgi:hypothetical protein